MIFFFLFSLAHVSLDHTTHRSALTTSINTFGYFLANHAKKLGTPIPFLLCVCSFSTVRGSGPYLSLPLPLSLSLSQSITRKVQTKPLTNSRTFFFENFEKEPSSKGLCIMDEALADAGPSEVNITLDWRTKSDTGCEFIVWQFQFLSHKLMYVAYQKPIFDVGVGLLSSPETIATLDTVTLRLPVVKPRSGGPLLDELLEVVGGASWDRMPEEKSLLAQDHLRRHAQVDDEFLPRMRDEITSLLNAQAPVNRDAIWALFCAAKRFASNAYKYVAIFPPSLEKRVLYACYRWLHPELQTVPGLSSFLSKSFLEGNLVAGLSVNGALLQQSIFSPDGCAALYEEAINMAAFLGSSLKAEAGVYVDAFGEFKKALNSIVEMHITPRARAVHPLLIDLCVVSAYFIRYDGTKDTSSFNHHERHVDASDLTFNTCVASRACEGGELVLHHPDDRRGIFGKYTGMFQLESMRNTASASGFLALKFQDIVVVEEAGPSFPLLRGHTRRDPTVSGLFDPRFLSPYTEPNSEPMEKPVSPWCTKVVHKVAQSVIHGGQLVHTALPCTGGSRTQFIFW